MATPDRAEIGHKLRQHDNEFESVYELLTQVDGKVDALATRMDGRFEQVDARLEQVDGKVDGLAARMDARFDEVLDLIRSGQG